MKQVINWCLFCSALILMSFTLIPEEDRQVKIKIETPHGNMIAVLYNETPEHRDNFVKNIKNGVYDSLLWHRVIYEFMIQGGDPDSKNADSAQVLGNGTLGYTVPAEFVPEYYHKKGALAAARMGDNVNPDKASSSCQFYIVHGKVFTDNILTMMEDRMNNQKRNEIFNRLLMQPEYEKQKAEATKAVQEKNQARLQEIFMQMQPEIEKILEKEGKFVFSPEQRSAYTSIGGAPHLDGAYTVFGEVVEGLEVIDKIAREKVDGNNRPLKDVHMKISIVEE